MEKKVPGRIKKLEETVINRIVAAEVIQRPVNALKELLENSLDAGPRSIQVVVKSGGMKLLKVQDDGSGIRKEDLPIVCERFTTSKLEKFEDLQNIGTYGFRGEALASISHVAKLSILTKTADSQCAFRAEYSDGKLKEYPPGKNVQNPKPCAGKQGTTIIVEDLFYNMETRRRTLKGIPDEHNKIVEVVTKYAVHNAGVGFLLKFGETMKELRTLKNASVLDNIKVLYGDEISRELVDLKCVDKSTGFELNGYISNVNYSTEKLMFLLFINHRLVDSPALRKSIEAVYYNYLPKGSHPFVYLSIEIDPRNVDLNVHLTKHEVHFLHEDMIITSIANAAKNILVGSNHSQPLLVKSLLPGASLSNESISSSAKGNSKDKERSSSQSQLPTTAPKNLVRTDPKIQKLDKFLSSTPNPDMSRVNSFQDSPSRIDPVDKTTADVSNVEMEKAPQPGTSVTAQPSPQLPQPPSTKRREIRLRSLRSMKQSILDHEHQPLTNALRNHTFVGCVDRSLSLIQHDLNLYICNNFRLSAELFYQKMLQDFGNFSKIFIEEPITIKELVDIALKSGRFDAGDQSFDEVATEVHNVIMNNRKMLQDYFSLQFNDDGMLETLPSILDHYFPNMYYLPDYIMKLGKQVNWTDEKPCFESFCHATSTFYAIQPETEEDNAELTLNGKSWKWTIEHIFFPEIKKSICAPKQFAEDSTIVLVTSLPDLYNFFKSC